MPRIIIVSVASLLFIILLYFSNLFTGLSETALDTLFLLRGETAPSPSIAIIGIDDKSLQELGAWPFSRENHAKLIQHLSQVEVVGLDILFSESAGKDKTFDTALKEGPPVALAAAHGYSNLLQKPTAALKNYTGVGHIETLLGAKGVVRKVQLVQKEGIAALSVVMLKAAGYHAAPLKVSSPLLINYYGPEFTFSYYSYTDVLHGKYSENFFKGRLVLVGAEALGLGDVHVTPFVQRHPMPGVEIQATILNNLLDNSFIRSPWLLSPAVTALFFCLSLFLWPASSEKRNLLVNISVCSILLITSFVLFQYNIFLEPLRPILFLFAGYLLHLVLQGLGITRELMSEISALDARLEKGLKELYTNVPSQLRLRESHPKETRLLTGGLRRHLLHMHDGIQGLELQNRFIHHLLQEEVAPLILWEIEDGKVILANATFKAFWKDHKRDARLPDLPEFLKFLTEQQLSDVQDSPVPSSAVVEKEDPWAIDISLYTRHRTHYFQVKMHHVDEPFSSFSGVLVNIADITEVRELERMKSDLIGTVSHELRLPLTTILGYSEMLTEMLDEEPGEFAKEICSQATRLNSLIENFLDIAKIENSINSVRKLPLNLIDVLEDSVNAVTPLALTKSIALHIDTPNKVSPILGDEPLLLQAIINLLDNAIKFSPRHTEVRLKLVEGVDRMVITVSDQGPGIAEEDRAMIFEKFNRGSGENIEDGFGLGLNLVQQVIVGHGGNIRVERPDEKAPGTTFSILLPKSLESPSQKAVSFPE
jgi:signal transduction histidine kinase/CHASE2 domain-containing sensor protein